MSLSPARLRVAGLVLALLSLLAPVGNAQPLESSLRPARLHTGASTTQTVSLSPGVNLVSLYVLPDNPSLDVLLGDIAEHVDAVSSEDGRAYAPRHGVQSLSSWEGGRSYRIHVSADAPSSLTFDVSGARLEPETELVLAKGWNEIAYLHASPLPVDEALVSVAASLDLIEAVDGRVYPASAGRSALATLDPGHGYRIHLSRADTLVLADAGGGDSDPDYRVATIAEALALTGLAVDDTVEVAGYAEAGDGGGGQFVVVDSGDAPDGGTVFVPYEFTRETTASGLERTQSLFEGEGIAFESFRLYYGPGEDDFYSAVELHGHGASYGGRRLFDPATGDLTIPWGALSYAEERTGARKLSARYRFATGPRRLVRQIPALRLEGELTKRYVRPEWWGARPYPEAWTPDPSSPNSPGAEPTGIALGDPQYDATDEVGTAMMVAAAQARTTGQQCYVVLEGMFGYGRILEIQEGAPLKGIDDGVRDGNGLRVLKGAPWRFWAMDTDRVLPGYEEPKTPLDWLQGGAYSQVVVRHGRRSNLSRIVDIELDGNLAENEYVFSREYRDASGSAGNAIWSNRVEEILQNSSQWNGFVAGTAPNDAVVGSNARLENVHVHDYGGSIMLGNYPVHFGGSRDLRLGNTMRNHVMYGVSTKDGTTVDDIEIYGYWWKGAIPINHGHYRRLAFVDIEPNPRFNDMDTMVGHRNAAPDPSEIGDPGAPKHYWGETVLLEDVRVELGPELRPREALFNYDNGPFSIRGLSLNIEGATPVQVMADRGDREQSARSRFELTDAVVERGRVYSMSGSSSMEVDVRRVALEEETEGDQSIAGFEFRPVRTGHVARVYDIGAGTPFETTVALKIWPRSSGDDTSLDVFVRNAAFRGIQDAVNFKRLDPASPGVQERYRVFWKDVTMNRWLATSNDGGEERHSYHIQYFENVTARGRKSEATGSFTHPAGGNRNHIDLTPGLFFTPYSQDLVRITNVRVNGTPEAGLVTGAWADVSSETYNAPDGTSYDPVLRLELSRRLRSGETVTFDWEAAIRPIPDGVVFPD